MSKDLINFIQEIKESNLTMTNKHLVQITPCNLMKNHSVNNDRLILYCDKVTLPGSTFVSQPLKFFGEVIERPNEKTYNTVTLSFLVDGELDIKHYFDTWISSIINPITRTISYYDDYISTIDINLTENNEIRYRTTLFEAYPKTINDIELDYASAEIMRLSITLTYRYFESTKQ